MAIRLPSIDAMIPPPLTTSVFSTTSFSVTPRYSTKAFASGWSDSLSIFAIMLLTLATSSAKKTTSATLGFPWVRVPVLSKTMVSTRLKSPITSLPFKRIPCFAPLPIPATLETGTPMTNAPGQPKTKMVMANSMSFVRIPTIMDRAKTAGV
ncbi:hypothetical protein SDC9_90726 [bioreactor metagenome]|uniref:Uncharacterized protein n=1 Tax=bioreactor metagenome TaxID=1076179 RepID=A0A644ZUF9_9ZZZZ